MYVQKQFSVFMVNKPGILAQILSAFATDKINITALTVMDSVEHGVMRIVAANEKKMRVVLKRINLQFNETDVLCVNLPNTSGAFAAITEKLAKAHINIAYAYCTSGARGGKTTAVLKLADVDKAIKVLNKAGGKTSKPGKPSTKRSPASRR
ncbi:MAG: ACT domain-containing protein [Anaerohalosphaeraceae bacterium]|nr:ACT domain-containing protein [Anaerohalosphaeraceae bacterium]